MKQFWKTAKQAIIFSWQTAPALYFGRMMIQIAQGALPLVNAFLAGRIINLVVAYLVHRSGPTSEIFLLTFIVAVLSLVTRSLSNLDRYWSEITEYRFDLHLQQTLFSQFQRLDHSYYE